MNEQFRIQIDTQQLDALDKASIAYDIHMQAKSTNAVQYGCISSAETYHSLACQERVPLELVAFQIETIDLLRSEAIISITSKNRFYDILSRAIDPKEAGFKVRFVPRILLATQNGSMPQFITIDAIVSTTK